MSHNLSTMSYCDYINNGTNSIVNTVISMEILPLMLYN